jgi:hypothetical protein
MNCANHPEVAANAYCRTCGKALCATCARDVRGVIYCESCLAERLQGTQPPTAGQWVAEQGLGLPPGTRVPSPGAAAALGFIPGVGAMYNGQFMKGVIHVLVFVCMIWVANRVGPIMVPVFFAYFFYLVFDAYKTAHALELGQPVPDPFGLEAMLGGGTASGQGTMAAASAVDRSEGAAAGDYQRRHGMPTGAIVLIILGVLFLLGNLEVLDFDWTGRLWPIILIVIGGWLFAKRWNR